MTALLTTLLSNPVRALARARMTPATLATGLTSVMLAVVMGLGLVAIGASPAATSLAPAAAPQDAAAFCTTQAKFSGYLSSAASSGAAMKTTSNSATVYGYITAHQTNWSCNAFNRYSGIVWNTTATLGTYDWGELTTSYTAACMYGTVDVESNPAIIHANATTTCPSNFGSPLVVSLTANLTYQRDLTHTSIGDFSFVHTSCSANYGAEVVKTSTSAQTPTSNSWPGASCDVPELDDTNTTQSFKIDTTAPPAPGYNTNNATNTYLAGPGSVIYFKNNTSGSFILTSVGTDTLAGAASNTFSALSATTGWTYTAGTVAGASSAKTLTWASGAVSSSLTLTTTDAAGNTGGATTVTITADSAGPAASFSAPAAATTKVATAAGATINVSDAGVGVDAFSVYRDKAPLTNNACGTFVADTAESGDGSFFGIGGDYAGAVSDFVSYSAVGTGACYRYRVVATDLLGNSTTVTSNSIKYDPTAANTPVVTDNTSGLTWAYRTGNTIFVNTTACSSQVLTLTSTATDDETAVASSTFGAFSGANWATYVSGSVAGNPASKSLTCWSTSTGGTLAITAVDSATNSSPAVTITITVDNTAPTAGAFTAPASNIIQSATGYTFSWNPASDTSGIAAYQRVLQWATIASPGVCDTTWGNQIDHGNSTSTSIVEPTGGTGIYTGYCWREAVRPQDNVGNGVTWYYSPSILVDSTAAGTGTGSVTIGDDSATNTKLFRSGSTLWFRASVGGTAALSITGVDPQSGITTTTFNTLTGTTTGWTPTASLAGQANGASRTYTWTTSATGNATFTGTVINGAGVSGSSSAITLTPDAGAPTASISAPAAGIAMQTGTSATVTFASNDALSGLSDWTLQRQKVSAGQGTCGTFSNDTGGLNLVSGSATSTQNSVQTLLDGYCYQWVLTATDAVGNVTTATSGKVLVDASAPANPDWGSATGSDTFRSGNTVFFKSSASGSVTLNLGSLDAESGVTIVNFGALSGSPSGWSPTTSEAVTATASAGSKTYTWSPGASDTTLDVSAVNGVGLTGGNLTVTLTGDASAPSATQDIPAGTNATSSTTYNISFDFDELGSGLSGNWTVQLQKAPATAGTCGSFANDIASGNLVSGTSLSAQSTTQVLVNGSCYRWVFAATDRVGNAFSVTSGVVIEDTAAPVSSASVSAGTAGSNGWYVTTPSVAISASDGASGVASTSYEIDGGSTIAYSGDFTLPTDGTHVITYRSTDAAGNVETNKSFTVKVDKTAPVPTFGAPVGTEIQGAITYDVSWSTSDPNSGVASRSLQRQSGANVAGACTAVSFADDGAATTSASPQHESGLTPGFCYRWILTVTDNAGNSNAPLTSGTVLIDSTAPDIAFTAPVTDSSQATTGVTVSWTESSIVGISGRSLQRQVSTLSSPGACVGDWTDSGSAVTAASPSSQTLPTSDRCYRWILTVTDVVSRSSVATSATIIYDASAPTTSASASGTAGNASWFTSSSVSVTLSASDATSAVGSVIYKIDAGANVTYSAPFAVTGAGTHTITFHAVDAVGNVESNKTFTVKIDSVKPVTTASASGTAGTNGWFTSSSASVTLSATDASSGVSTTTYEVDGGSSATYAGAFVVSGEGSHNVTFRSTDTAGNVEVDKSFTVKIDTAKPSSVGAITSGSMGDNGWYKSAVTVTVTASDATSGVGSIKYTINGGSTQTYSAPVSISTPGVVTFAFWSVDAAGNTETSGSIVYQADGTAPVSAIDAMTTPVNSADLSIPFTASDGTSGFTSATLYARVNGSATGNTGAVAVGTFTTSPIAWTAPSDGIWHLYLRATDAAGNVEAAPTNPEVNITVDTSAPVTTLVKSCTAGTNGWCKGPASVTFTTSDLAGVSATSYRVDGGAWTDYAGAFVVSGDAIHTVEYSSTDVLGNLETIKSADVKIDTATPSTAASLDGLQYPESEIYGTAVVVTLSSTDATSGVNTTTYKVDGAAVATTYSGAIVVNGTAYHTVTWTTTDVAGNVSTGSTTFDIDLQTTTVSAAVTCSHPGLAGWCLVGAQVTLTAEDPLFPIVSINYSPDGGASRPYTGPFSFAGTGNHTVSFTATNSVGTVATGTTTAKVDRSDPTMSVKQTGSGTTVGGAWYRTNVVVTFTLGDAGSGSPTATYTLDGGAVTPYTTGFTLSTQGTHVITWTVRDLAGRTWSGSNTINVDFSVPVATLAALPATSDSALLTLPLTTSDAFGKIVSVQLYYSTSSTALPSTYTAGPIFTWTSSLTSLSWIDPYNGAIYLFARATDKAGNVQPFPSSRQATTVVTVASPIAGTPSVTTSVNTTAKTLVMALNAGAVSGGTTPYKTYTWYLKKPIFNSAAITLGTLTTATGTLSVSCTTALPGSKLYYKVTDTASRTATSDQIDLTTVCPSNLANLTPYISNPNTGTSLLSGTTIPFTVELFGGNGTYKVTWYVKSIKQGVTVTTTASSNTASLKMPVVTVTTNVTVQATIADTAGHIATATVVVSVHP